jgi:crossover junction endodeoxyribonuclease RusA
MKIVLPWPPASLSPNARTHWAAKAKAFKDYKLACMWELRFIGVSEQAFSEAPSFNLIFHPPSKRRMDIDNAIGRFKAGLDAIAEITGIDDSKFKLSFLWGVVVKGGCVEIEA